jgi:hypothetical protein
LFLPKLVEAKALATADGGIAARKASHFRETILDFATDQV